MSEFASNFNNFNDADRDTTMRVPSKSVEEAFYVFTVADMISDRDKSSNPEWRTLGGVIRSESLALEYRSGYIPRCEITELWVKYESTRRSNVHPDKREMMATHYELAAVNPRSGKFEQKTVGINANGEHDGLLRRPFYPESSAGALTGQNDGVVRFPVRNNREKNLAQKFLFPNWDQIKQGLMPLPASIPQLKAYFYKRLASVQNPETGELADTPHAELFRDAAYAAIRSCDDFAQWGNTRIVEANDRYDQAKAKGWAWSYGADARRISAQLGIALRDTAASAESAKLDKLVDSVAVLAELQVSQMRQNQPVAPVVASFDMSAPLKQEIPAPVAETDASDEAEKQAPDAPADPEKVLFNGRQADVLEKLPFGKAKIQYLDGEREIAVVARKDCDLIAA